MVSDEKAQERVANVLSFARASRPLYSVQESLISYLEKEDMADEAPSRQGVSRGKKEHPFNFDAVHDFREFNVHHSTCIETKKEATVGLGFRSGPPKMPQVSSIPGAAPPMPEDDDQSKVSEILDPICNMTFQDVLGAFTEDYWETGNGYIEVVRDGDVITGLHHLPSGSVHITIEDDLYNYHFEINSGAGGTRRFSRFGERDQFLKRMKAGANILGFDQTEKDVSEVIHWRRSTSLNRYYGYPDWLAATAGIELSQAVHQHLFDFFLNRGVPEFMLFILGKKLDEKEWETVESGLKAQIGMGNSHKSFALNLDAPPETMEIQLEKLGLEGKSDAGMFRELSETLALEIVSAHRVPPLLAGILIPGKLGATNELPNALMAFQVLCVGPAQQSLFSLLGSTLGNPKMNGGLSLAPNDFKLRKITEVIDLGTMSTVGGMRQTVPEAQAQGRDIGAGLKKAADQGSVLAKVLLEQARAVA